MMAAITFDEAREAFQRAYEPGYADAKLCSRLARECLNLLTFIDRNVAASLLRDQAEQSAPPQDRRQSVCDRDHCGAHDFEVAGKRQIFLEDGEYVIFCRRCGTARRIS